MIENPDELNDLFHSIGFGFPEDSDQLEKFNRQYENFAFKAQINKIDPKKILESIKNKTAEISNVDYHKRTVLAAELVFRMKDEWSLGHLKLQKLLYLCQNAMKMSIHTNFLKQAMGPYDPKLMRSIDKQFEQRKWFKFQQDDFPKYIPLEKAGEHHEWFSKYFKKDATQIDFLIDTFREMKTHQVELIATIFACWNEIHQSHQSLTDDLLIENFYLWSKEKEKFSKQEILKSIQWMKEKGITPIS